MRVFNLIVFVSVGLMNYIGFNYMPKYNKT